ncbi:hypothetical protein A8709_12955 [Paenibacillus pectinilyticus]|uniref:DUF4830 domain-containing protein n=1 Tax=Paenibacillus pectinilyticus TaxID=512399 RepID=A0A1C1A392_9BACL|nr:hypothetical protein [Paenibacillus pectinilyticus]OCT15023.1 hypothetical protein A8709_12955 [Paenibacillus pectinilyticus]
MKTYMWAAVFFLIFIVSIWDDHAKMPVASIQPLSVPKMTFSEERALEKTIRELGLPNVENNTVRERNVNFCGKDRYAVEFGVKIQPLEAENYLVLISEKWRNDADHQEKLNRIRFYYVSPERFELQYQDGSIAATIGECSDDVYGLKSFQPVSPGVFIPQKDLDQISNLGAKKEAILAFVQAWASRNRGEFAQWMESNAMTNEMIDTLLDVRYSYAFTGIDGSVMQNNGGEYCMGIDYQRSDSVEKEEREFKSAVCVRPDDRGKWHVYMID